MADKPPWTVWTGESSRSFPTFRRAEAYARGKIAAAGKGSVEVTFKLHNVATVRIDGCNRVWTDLRDSWDDLPDAMRAEIVEATHG